MANYSTFQPPAPVSTTSRPADDSTSSRPRFWRFSPRAVAAPTLPQGLSPDDLSKRSDELVKNQALYKYESPPTIPGIAFIKGPVDKLPGQEPTFWWKVKAALIGARVLLNFTGFFKALSFVFSAIFTNQNDSQQVASTLSDFRIKADSRTAADKSMARFRKARIGGSQFEEKNPVLEPYRDMWRLLDKPQIADNFLEDKVFTRLRVAGFNPISLRRVFNEAEMPFPIDEGRLPTAGDTVASAIVEKRLYYLDYSFLSGIQQQLNSNKICVVTRGLFAIPSGGGDLKPVAIEVSGEVVYPPKLKDPPSTRWAIAKMALNNDDAIHHELIAHLGRTHLLVEPFIAATMRQLPSDHPVHVLFKPHFEGTVFINDTASTSLVAPGGDVDRIFAGEIDSVMKWCAGQVVDNKFNSSMPDVEMKERGVDDPILYFPYREDALEHFDALNEWVSAYLGHYYESDAAVQSDSELQAWVAELINPNCGRVKDFGDKGDGKVLTLKYLARAITFVIFSGSVQHAAVNFPQRSLMSYAPAIAGGLYSVPPKAGETADLQKYYETLTPVQTAIEQIQILCVIGAVYYTKLGKYRSSEMPRDRPIQNALKAYKARLEKIDKRIRDRESTDPSGTQLVYDYMRPDNIPQSINI